MWSNKYNVSQTDFCAHGNIVPLTIPPTANNRAKQVFITLPIIGTIPVIQPSLIHLLYFNQGFKSNSS